MDSDSATTSPGEPEPEPDIERAGLPQTAIVQQKSRVRFDSTTATQQPQLSSTNPRERTGGAPGDSILRYDSSGRYSSDEIQYEAQPASDRSAAAAFAQHRGTAMAKTVWRKTPSSPLSSAESPSYNSSSISEYELLGDTQDIALQGLQCDMDFSENCTCSPYEQYQYVAETTTSMHHSNAAPGANHEAEEGDQKLQKTEREEIYNGTVDGSYNVPTPEHYRGGVLSQLLRLHKHADLQPVRSLLPASPKVGSPKYRWSASQPETGSATPNYRKWYEQNNSQDTLATLIQASTKLAKPAQPGADGNRPRPQSKSSNSMANRLSAKWHREDTRVKVHIADTLARQEFILKVCRALMLYGAPTHRLEEYLTMTARALEIEAQFLYLPGCMIISFDDATTHTTEVKLVRLAQGIDLGKLKDVHRIYKEAIHDVIGVEEATVQLEEIMAKKAKFHPWFRVLIFGLTSAAASPFSFNARLIDLPLCFCFGSLVGALQIIVSPKLPLYSNVFEVSATVLVSFLARAFGSIRGGDLFCFSALAQGGIVMLLPGYMFLSSSLELQARAIVPGSIRIVYGVIYSLLLSFGITIGAALYGLTDSNATSNLTCSAPLPGPYTFPFVPFFVLCISILYQAKWGQIPIMVTIAFAGHIVNYYSTLRFPSSPQISSTLGAFAVGSLANFYSRFGHGVAAAILIPAIFTQVPGGLASTGGLLSGLQVANEINNATNATSSAVVIAASSNSVVFDVAGSMIQIAIGITVGLFLSALVVYPFGKRRSGLFSF